VPDRRLLEARAPALDRRSRPADPARRQPLPAQALRAPCCARALGATVIGDFHRETPAVRRLLPYVDHPIVPLEFVASRGSDPRRTLRELAEAGGGVPVVTLGRHGGLYLERGRVRRFRAFRARVVDTTGAGDVLHGAFAAGLAHGLPLAACLELGARAAARACTALGGTRGCCRASSRSRAASAREATRSASTTRLVDLGRGGPLVGGGVGVRLRLPLAWRGSGDGTAGVLPALGELLADLDELGALHARREALEIGDEPPTGSQRDCRSPPRPRGRPVCGGGIGGLAPAESSPRAATGSRCRRRPHRAASRGRPAGRRAAS
jgi:hypothetical protein